MYGGGDNTALYKAKFRDLRLRGVHVREDDLSNFLTAVDTNTVGVSVHCIAGVRIQYDLNLLTTTIRFLQEDFFLAWCCLCFILQNTKGKSINYLVYYQGLCFTPPCFVPATADDFYFTAPAYQSLSTQVLSSQVYDADTITFCFILKWPENSDGLEAFWANRQRLIYLNGEYGDSFYRCGMRRELERWKRILWGIEEEAPSTLSKRN